MTNLKKLNDCLSRLHLALEKNSSNVYRLQLWSQFIRERDGHQCVLCRSSKKLAAHHIMRKSLWKHLRFQLGNGITLCSECHKAPHKHFNRRPDLNLPIDEEGGENLDLMTGMLGALIYDARKRNIKFEPYYNFDESAIVVFKKIQGLDGNHFFKGSSIEQTYSIWCQTSRYVLNALMKCNGIELPEDFVQDEAISLFNSEDDETNGVVFFRYIPPDPIKREEEN